MPMIPRGLRLVRRRLLQAVPVLVFVILGTFLLLCRRRMRRARREAGGSDYRRAALAKGLSRRRIVWRHMARNAVLPVATMIGLQASALLGGSVVIETVFAVPGMGRLAYEAV